MVVTSGVLILSSAVPSKGCVCALPEQGCSGEVGGVSGTLQLEGSLIGPCMPRVGGICSTGRSPWAMSTKAAG